jgi:hypothetical protein
MIKEIAILLDDEFDFLVIPSRAQPGQTPNLFRYNMPDSPDIAVALYQYDGEAPSQTMGDPLVWEKPRLQVLVRHPDSVTEAMETYMYPIWRFLASIKGQNVNGVFIHKISPVGSPSEIGPDSAGRERLSANFSIEKDA